MTDQVAEYAYLINGNQSKLLSTVIPLRELGIRLHIIYEPTRDWRVKTNSSGTLVVRTDGRSEGSSCGRCAELAERYDLEVDAG